MTEEMIMEIKNAIAKGYSVEAIADALDVSVSKINDVINDTSDK